MNLQPPLKLFTLEAANRLLPSVRGRLTDLRASHREILALQGRVDIEELAGTDGAGQLSDGARTRIAELNELLLKTMETFEEQLENFHALGCELKDLARGLVDFYTMREGELAYLCWHEGEDEIRYWHTLEGGFGAREAL